MITPMSAKTLSVAIVEDRAAIRRGITLLMDSTAGFRCAGSYGTMEEALVGILTDPPDLVLVDLVLPGISGVEGIRRLRERQPDLALLVFTVYEDDERVFEALCAGARGCLPKKTPAQSLLETIRTVAAGGGGPMSPDCARCALRVLGALRPEAGSAEPGGLQRRSVRLLEFLAQGYNLRTAAIELGVTEEAVATLMREAYDALHRQRASEASP